MSQAAFSVWDGYVSGVFRLVCAKEVMGRVLLLTYILCCANRQKHMQICGLGKIWVRLPVYTDPALHAHNAIVQMKDTTVVHTDSL